MPDAEMDTRGDSLSDSAHSRVRILGWLTITLAVAPYAGMLVMVLFLILSGEMSKGGPGGPNIGLSAAVGGLAYAAVIQAPLTLLLCLTARGLFRHRPWARTLTIVLAAVVFVLTLLLGGGIGLVLYNLLDQRHRHRGYPIDITSYVLGIAILSPPFLACCAYCLGIHLWIRKQPVRALFSGEARSNRRN